MPRPSSLSRLTALGCVVLSGGLLLPPRAYADTPVPRTPIQDTARLVIARDAGAPAMKERRAQQDAGAPRTDLRTKSFFKTPAGIATLIIFGAGVGYAAYSAKDDRIKSTGR